MRRAAGGCRRVHTERLGPSQGGSRCPLVLMLGDRNLEVSATATWATSGWLMMVVAPRAGTWIRDSSPARALLRNETIPGDVQRSRVPAKCQDTVLVTRVRQRQHPPTRVEAELLAAAPWWRTLGLSRRTFAAGDHRPKSLLKRRPTADHESARKLGQSTLPTERLASHRHNLLPAKPGSR